MAGGDDGDGDRESRVGKERLRKGFMAEEAEHIEGLLILSVEVVEKEQIRVIHDLTGEGLGGQDAKEVGKTSRRSANIFTD